MDKLMRIAIEEAQKGKTEGGIPSGSVLVKNRDILGKGHNRRIQDNNPIMHAEINCLNNVGRMRSYRGTILYSTLMLCYLCAGAVVQFGIKNVVVGESETFLGAREFMESHGVEVIDLDLDECKELMLNFIEANPEGWNEDIGE